MSLDFLERYILKNFNLNTKKKPINKVEWVGKLTHLFLNGKRISEIGDLTICPNLKVLYLHNNSIGKITNLNALPQLTHLYLQWNKISEFNNFNQLTSLRKLYLGNNEIKRLENIENLGRLEELHLEHQRLEMDQEFSFDEKSMKAIGKTLRILNISGLNMKNLRALELLHGLEELIATENKFESPQQIGNDLNRLPFLINVDVSGCPAQKDLHYREKITVGAQRLEILDGKEIPRNTRNFIKRLEEIKAARRLVKSASADAAIIPVPKKQPPPKIKLPSKSAPQLDLFVTKAPKHLCYQSWNSLTPHNFRKYKKSAMLEQQKSIWQSRIQADVTATERFLFQEIYEK